MKRKSRLPELLSPAGDMRALYAAVAAGADAVYVGGKSFGARAFAKNFDTEELAYAVRYTHLFGVKLYVTVNTLVYDIEMSALSEYLVELWRIGVDAIITADLGVIAEARRRVPGLAIHASTQMSVHNTPGADTAAELGCERVVLARELSLSDIVSVTERCSVETEVFLHGALCVCHSGQCLMSSLVGGRSGNRGECAQPCRLPYNGGRYPLSLSDLSLADHVRELVASGTASLKIEGRMKSAEYVYTVTDIYRRLLDDGRDAAKREREALRRAFSRDGFTDGYFRGDKFSHMTGVRSESDKESSRSLAEMSFEPMRKAVRARVSLRLGEPSEMTLTDGERSVTAHGAVPSAAMTSPLSEPDVKARLSRMGATLLVLSSDDIELYLDDGINLPPSALNALRRDAAEKLLSCEREVPGIDEAPPSGGTVRERRLSDAGHQALFLRKSLFSELFAKHPGACDIFDVVFLPLEDYGGECGGVYLPPVIFDSELAHVRSLLASAMARGARYALVGNIGHIPLVREYGLIARCDFRLNITNSSAKHAYEELLGVSLGGSAVLSPELTLPQLRDIGGGAIAYGRIPLMLTERCFIRENFGCERCESAYLTDRTGARFPLVREFGHRNLLLNSRVTYMGDKASELDSARIGVRHFIFSVEGVHEAADVIEKYRSGHGLEVPVRRIGRR